MFKLIYFTEEIKIKKVYVCRSDLKRGHVLSKTTQMLSGVI